MPKIDLSSIPGLDGAKALFGSISERAGGPDDIVDIMVYIYDTIPPPPPPPGLF